MARREKTGKDIDRTYIYPTGAGGIGVDVMVS
jgi:hypothetical protein